MAEQGLKNEDLAKLSGLSLGAIKSLRPKRTLKRVEVQTLNALCKALQCQTNDLLPYSNDE